MKVFGSGTILLVLLLAANTATWCQQKYWIYFNTQTMQTFDEHIEKIRKKGVEPIVISQWLNAVSTYLTDEQVLDLKSTKGIRQISPVACYATPSSIQQTDTIDVSLALDQINARALISTGLSGKGIKIGIVDGGFYRSDKEDALRNIIEDDRVLGYKNFIEKDLSDPFLNSKKFNDYHGTRVWTAIAGNNGKLISGLAPNALFYLARTDQADKEYRGEEDYWVAALEWMHGEGVRLVNSSLGYSDGYDRFEENYSPEDVDGKSSAITQAARIAVEEKGMLIVISAGNDGSKKFKVISVPSDAEGVITVGATDYSHWNKATYSSIGPETLNYVKPDVACFSRSGTSFSAPVITGLAACIMEANPELSNKEVKKIILASSHLHSRPNNFIGHGVPDAHRILDELNGDSIEAHNITVVKAENKPAVILTESRNIVAFHTMDKRNVLEQEKLTATRGVCRISRKKNARFTIVATTDHIWEIEW